MNENKNTRSIDDEISLKELILKCKEIIIFIFARWYVIAFFSLVFCGYQYYSYLKIKSEYTAETRFIIEGQSGSGDGIGGLLGAIGMGKSNKTNPYKILEVGMSTNTLVELLNEKLDNGKGIGNLLIEEYFSTKEVEGEQMDEDYRFKDNMNIESLDEYGLSLIRKLKSKVWGNPNHGVAGLLTFELDNDSGIYSISAKTETEDLSLGMSKKMYSYVKGFFEEDVFLKQKQLGDILTAKSDSLELLRNSTVRRLANFENTNRSAVSFSLLSEKQILMAEIQAINSAYIEVIKNREMNDVRIKDIQPLFMAIDTPYKPLSVSNPSLFKFLITGLFLGVFLSVFILVIRKVYLDIMNN